MFPSPGVSDASTGVTSLEFYQDLYHQKPDRLIELRLYVPPDTKLVILETLPSQSLGLVLKTKSNTKKQTCIHNKLYYNIK